MAQLVSDEVFEEMFMWLCRIFNSCIAITAHDVSTVIMLTNMMQNAIDSEFMQCFSGLYGCSVCSICVDLFVSFVDESI